jgi:serine/threonine protein kinase
MMAAERFRIVRFIKRGGMGEVYEAFDSVLETRVALKTILSTACDSPRAVRKLKAEVQLARSIRHPNVCSVFDIWEHHANKGDGASVYFFTMEFIDGMTLGQLLQRSRLDSAEALRLARLQLLGLRAAHVSGVVHRDFKSENVMLRNDRQDDAQVVVMDFGLARPLHTEDGAVSNDSEQFAGSVAYMAPEQVEGRRNIGPEADVFAFGVVLFEMLTGQLPYVGDSPWTTATLRLTQRAPPPSRLRPGLSPRIDAFVMKCLNRQPADRFHDAREALIALEQLLRPPPRRSARRWLGVALGAFLVAAVVFGIQRRTASRTSSLQPSVHVDPPPPGTPASVAPAPVAPAPPKVGEAATPPEAVVGGTVGGTEPSRAPPAASSAPLQGARGEPGPSPPASAQPEPERAPNALAPKRVRPTPPDKSLPPAPSPPPPENAPPSAPASEEMPAQSPGAAAPAQTIETPTERAEHAPGAPAKLRDFE